MLLSLGGGSKLSKTGKVSAQYFIAVEVINVQL